MQDQRCFRDIDIIGFIGRVVQRHTRYYQSNLQIDEMTLQRVAGCKEQQDVTFIWMCRTLGTWLLPERDVLLKGTSGNNIFTYYIEQTDDPVLVFAIKVMGIKGGLIIGDIYALDYPTYYDHVCSVMLKAETVTLQYERGIRIKRADDMITSHPDAEYGRCLSIRYQPRHQEDLDRLLQREWGERECSREGDADTYMEGLSDPVSCTTRKGLSIKQDRR